ncbi:MAG TPA: hypothetical protein VF187_05275 [Gemmatimonadales bacterium]
MSDVIPQHRLLPVFAGLPLALILVGLPLAGQAPPGANPADAVLQVFLDCHGPCDFDHVRREITYVNWVRDRQDADVHLLITTRGTGGGGEEFTMRFIGLRTFAGSDDEYRFNTQQSDTFEEIRGQLSQRIGLGLARYAARGPLAPRLRLTFQAPAGGAAATPAARGDPWNYWVFTASANANFFSESQYSSRNFSGQLRARRVTEAWKVNLSVRGSRSTSRFDLEDQVVRSKTSDYTLNTVLTRSIGEHWSLGLNGGARRSSRDNYDLLVRLAPGIEYDLFPYKESSRRQLVFVYEVGISHANYSEETIYSKLRETRPSQALTVAVEAVQPWGNVEARLTGFNYLDDWSQNRLTLDGGIELRLARGLNLDLFGSYSRVRDQLSLAKEGATDEDVLLQLKQLATSYTLNGFIGLSYTFGSKFNNVVNPRFGNSRFDF